MDTAGAIEYLERVGATRERREDMHGVARSGWWLDGVWLAPVNDPWAAIAAIEG